MGSVQHFVSLYLWLVWIKKNGRHGHSKITNTNGGKLFRRPSSSYKKLLDRVAFWTGYIAWRVGYKFVTYNATSAGVGERNRLFLWICSRNCIITIVIINIIVYIIVVVVCKNRQANGPNKCKHEVSDFLDYSIFFILFYYTKLCTDLHVNKDFLLFEFWSKDSSSCSKVGVMHV